MGSTYDRQQTENSHQQLAEIRKQSRASKLALTVATISLIVSIVAIFAD